MGYRKKKDGLVELLFEASGLFWQFGAAVTVGLVIVAGFAFLFVHDHIVAAEANPMLAPAAHAYGWLCYLLPIILLALAAVFGRKTLATYLQQNRY